MDNQDQQDVSFLFNTDISGYTTNSIQAIKDISWLNLTLHGLRSSFNRIVQSTTTPEFAFTDRFKELLFKRTKGNLKYPYCYLNFVDLDLVKDQINTGAAARRGIINPQFSGNAVPVSYLFPIKFNITLNILDSDIQRMLSITQSIFLADVSRAFNFGIKAFDQLAKVKVQRTGNISFPEMGINTDQENDFATGHLTCGFEVQSWMGFTTFAPTVKNVKINVYTEEANLDPQLQFSYVLSEEEDASGKINFHKFFYPNSGRQ
jgi:hypothetical protein